MREKIEVLLSDEIKNHWVDNGRPMDNIWFDLEGNHSITFQEYEDTGWKSENGIESTNQTFQAFLLTKYDWNTAKPLGVFYTQKIHRIGHDIINYRYIFEIPKSCED